MQTAVKSKALLLSLLVACLLAATLATQPAAAFIDVPPEHWAYGDVTLLVSLGLVGGYEDGTYRPDDVVNRGQMAVYIGRTLRNSWVSAKPGWVEHVDTATDRVCAPVEMRATSYILYSSFDMGATWAPDATAVFHPAFFGGQFVSWTVTPGAPFPVYYKPIAVITTTEAKTCGTVVHDPAPGPGPIVGNVYYPEAPVPWFCWQALPYYEYGPCVSFYVIYVTDKSETPVEQYGGIVEGWVSKLMYGHEVGWPGVLSSFVHAPALAPGNYHVTVHAIDFVGNERARFDQDFTVLGPI